MSRFWEVRQLLLIGEPPRSRRQLLWLSPHLAHCGSSPRRSSADYKPRSMRPWPCCVQCRCAGDTPDTFGRIEYPTSYLSPLFFLLLSSLSLDGVRLRLRRAQMRSPTPDHRKVCNCPHLSLYLQTTISLTWYLRLFPPRMGQGITPLHDCQRHSTYRLAKVVYRGQQSLKRLPNGLYAITFIHCVLFHHPF